MKTAVNTFILGAGASMDYGFPSGQNLKNLAIEALAPGNSAELSVLLAAGREMGFEGSNVLQFRQDLMNSTMDPSIDSFIEAQQDRYDVIDIYEKIAKAVIAILIIKCEQPDNVRLGEGWYNKLFTKMYEDRRTYRRFLENKVSFITFNYDRSLEYYLTQAIKNQFNRTNAGNLLETDLANHFPIIHVHGSVGSYWRAHHFENFTPYDGDWQNSQNIIECASNIKLITDKINVGLDSGFQKAKQLIEEADTIHFIGFGFHRDNMERLGFDQDYYPEAGKLFGTIKGLSSQKVTECRGVYQLVTYPTQSLFSLSEPIHEGHTADLYLDIAPLH